MEQPLSFQTWLIYWTITRDSQMILWTIRTGTFLWTGLQPTRSSLLEIRFWSRNSNSIALSLRAIWTRFTYGLQVVPRSLTPPDTIIDRIFLRVQNLNEKIWKYLTDFGENRGQYDMHIYMQTPGQLIWQIVICNLTGLNPHSILSWNRTGTSL